MSTGNWFLEISPLVVTNLLAIYLWWRQMGATYAAEVERDEIFDEYALGIKRPTGVVKIEGVQITPEMAEAIVKALELRARKMGRTCR